MSKVVDTFLPVRRLTIMYICALTSVALLVLIGQVIIQIAIHQQDDDALIIGIAGRQSMLSQKIGKTALVIEYTVPPSARAGQLQDLQQSLDLWQRSQQGLLNGDASLGLPGHPSDEVKRLFNVISPNYEFIVSATTSLLSIADQDREKPGPFPNLDPHVQTILAQVPGFLTGMDQIVSQYQREAEGRVSNLRVLEVILAGTTLSVLAGEGWFIFRPTAGRLHQTIKEITELHHSIEGQKRELEQGIEQILQTHVQIANGDFSARAPLAEDHVLWQIGYSLNNLLARLNVLSRAESELRKTKLEANQLIGSLQSQATLIKNELQLIQTEAAHLVEVLHEAKTRAHPIRIASSRSLLEALCQELGGNYLLPALPPGSRSGAMLS
jgi:hypothetical protein